MCNSLPMRGMPRLPREAASLASLTPEGERFYSPSSEARHFFSIGCLTASLRSPASRDAEEVAP